MEAIKDYKDLPKQRTSTFCFFSKGSNEHISVEKDLLENIVEILFSNEKLTKGK